MLRSMTGFGSKEAKVNPYGKISVEIRSTNHKFLETIVHMPEGFMSLEEKVKKEIEGRLKRGRVVCSINISGCKSNNVFINTQLLNKYSNAFKKIRKEFKLKDDLSLDTVVHLPGVLALEGCSTDKELVWASLKGVVAQAMNSLLAMSKKEGNALEKCLKTLSHKLKKEIEAIENRFCVAIKKKSAELKTDEERSSFLNNSDITEELERLAFHVGNLTKKLSNTGPVGKELDFIAQEMQRETNTIGAKTCDALVSSKVVEAKSLIEKIREQVQNIE
ncbi:MAG: YicC family protein [Candidatus Omnitrophica bacterium]|nr:YicC family protein [Candidatus Omnitrophota bacterium]